LITIKPVLPQIAHADILINGLGKVDKIIIDACPNLKLVHQIGTGIDNVDVDYCTSKSVYVSNIPGINVNGCLRILTELYKYGVYYLVLIFHCPNYLFSSI
jgi:hypothetical protein